MKKESSKGENLCAPVCCHGNGNQGSGCSCCSTDWRSDCAADPTGTASGAWSITGQTNHALQQKQSGIMRGGPCSRLHLQGNVKRKVSERGGKDGWWFIHCITGSCHDENCLTNTTFSFNYLMLLLA